MKIRERFACNGRGIVGNRHFDRSWRIRFVPDKISKVWLYSALRP